MLYDQYFIDDLRSPADLVRLIEPLDEESNGRSEN